MRILIIIVYFFLVSLCVVPVVAQGDDCPTLVQSAITAIGNWCAAIGLNQACYGSISLQVNPQPGVTDFFFGKPGDIVRVANLKTLRADPFDAVKKEWGVVLMHLQANIPDMLPGQVVSFLVFGDVQLENKVPSIPAPLVTMPSNTVLLGTPQANGPIVGALSAGDQAFALNQSADGAWVRLELNSSDRRTGWIPSSLLPQVSALSTFDPNAPAPMQAFSLQTGVTGVKCAGVPQDGILVQTPGRGDIKIKLTVNDVNIELGSTAFFQAQPGNTMIISVIEGQATIESHGQIVVVPAGSWVSVPIDANLEPVGTISNPKGYEVGAMNNLPIGLLARPITVAPPIITTSTNLCVSNPNGAWLRAQPDSANQTILRVLAANAAVLDSGSTLNDGTQVWRQVETGDKQLTGWIEAASLSNCGNTNPVSITTTPAVLAKCTPVTNWTLIYTVQPGNTLAEIASALGVSPTELAQANCIADVNQIVVGQQLSVPKSVTVVTALPPAQPQRGTTPSPTTNATSQISSGRWPLTITTQLVGCASPTQPTTIITVADVQVSADLQLLSFTLGPNANTVSGTFNLRRSTPLIYSGTWGNSGKAILVVSGANQGAVNATGPCTQNG